MARKKKHKEPQGGWLGPPPTHGLKPLRVMGPDGKFKKVKQTASDRKKRKKWEKKLKKADKKGLWRFKWKG